MRADLVVQIITLSIIFPLIIGLIRIKVIHQSYYWFLGYLTAGFITELSALFIYDIKIINIIQDTFSLISVCLLLQLFHNWGFIKRNRNKFLRLLFLLIFIQLLDYILQANEQIKIPWGYMINMLILIVVSLLLLNDEFSFTKDPYFKNSRVLILAPLIIYYLYFIVLNLLMAFLFSRSTQKLFSELYYIINYINLFRYLSFSLALIWAPKREKYL